MRLWRIVSLAPHRLLMLDHDGTLAPFHAVRERAVPPPRTLELVRGIATTASTDVAIVSGRPIGELQALLGGLPISLVGEHGWEWREAGGQLVRHALPEGAEVRLARAEEVARGAGFTPYLERKRTCIAVHTRGLAEPLAREVEESVAFAWGRDVVAPPLRLTRFDGGIELRVAGRDKGTAVTQLLEGEAIATLAVYLGDDRTDEDAFEALRDRGFGVRVGAPDRATLATGWLSGPEEVVAFLEAWLRIAGGERLATG